MLHKKGAVGEQLSIVYFLFLALIIGGAIVIAIFMFYGRGYDFREAEAEMINSRIKECILENEADNDFFIDENFYRICHIDNGAVKKNNIIKICDGFSGECATSNEALFIEGKNFNICSFNIEGEQSYKCSIKEFSKGSKRYVVITGSNQISRRVLE